MTVATPRGTSSVIRRRLMNELVGLAVIAGILAVGTAVIVGLVAVFGTSGIDSSAWDATTQLARWYAGFRGAYLATGYLPLFVTHGISRRAVIGQLVLFVPMFAAVFAVCMTLGYAIEHWIYDMLGWPQTLSRTHIFESPTQYALVWTELVLIGVTWIVAGAVLGAAYYRGARAGFALLVPILAMVSLVEFVAGTQWLGSIPWAFISFAGGGFEGAGFGATAATTIVVASVQLTLLWILARDVPIRTRPG